MDIASVDLERDAAHDAECETDSKHFVPNWERLADLRNLAHNFQCFLVHIGEPCGDISSGRNVEYRVSVSTIANATCVCDVVRPLLSTAYC